LKPPDRTHRKEAETQPFSPRIECMQSKLRKGSELEQKWGGEEARGGGKREANGFLCFS